MARGRPRRAAAQRAKSPAQSEASGTATDTSTKEEGKEKSDDETGNKEKEVGSGKAKGAAKRKEAPAKPQPAIRKSARRIKRKKMPGEDDDDGAGEPNSVDERSVTREDEETDDAVEADGGDEDDEGVADDGDSDEGDGDVTSVASSTRTPSTKKAPTPVASSSRRTRRSKRQKLAEIVEEKQEEELSRGSDAGTDVNQNESDDDKKTGFKGDESKVEMAEEKSKKTTKGDEDDDKKTNLKSKDEHPENDNEEAKEEEADSNEKEKGESNDEHANKIEESESVEHAKEDDVVKKQEKGEGEAAEVEAKKDTKETTVGKAKRRPSAPPPSPVATRASKRRKSETAASVIIAKTDDDENKTETKSSDNKSADTDASAGNENKTETKSSDKSVDADASAVNSDEKFSRDGDEIEKQPQDDDRSKTKEGDKKFEVEKTTKDDTPEAGDEVNHPSDEAEKSSEAKDAEAGDKVDDSKIDSGKDSEMGKDVGETVNVDAVANLTKMVNADETSKEKDREKLGVEDASTCDLKAKDEWKYNEGEDDGKLGEEDASASDSKAKDDLKSIEGEDGEKQGEEDASTSYPKAKDDLKSNEGEEGEGENLSVDSAEKKRSPIATRFSKRTAEDDVAYPTCDPGVTGTVDGSPKENEQSKKKTEVSTEDTNIVGKGEGKEHGDDKAATKEQVEDNAAAKSSSATESSDQSQAEQVDSGHKKIVGAALAGKAEGDDGDQNSTPSTDDANNPVTDKSDKGAGRGTDATSSFEAKPSPESAIGDVRDGGDEKAVVSSADGKKESVEPKNSVVETAGETIKETEARASGEDTSKKDEDEEKLKEKLNTDCSLSSSVAGKDTKDDDKDAKGGTPSSDASKMKEDGTPNSQGKDPLTKPDEGVPGRGELGEKMQTVVKVDEIESGSAESMSPEKEGANEISETTRTAEAVKAENPDIAKADKSPEDADVKEDESPKKTVDGAPPTDTSKDDDSVEKRQQHPESKVNEQTTLDADSVNCELPGESKVSKDVDEKPDELIQTKSETSHSSAIDEDKSGAKGVNQKSEPDLHDSAAFRKHETDTKDCASAISKSNDPIHSSVDGKVESSVAESEKTSTLKGMNAEDNFKELSKSIDGHEIVQPSAPGSTLTKQEGDSKNQSSGKEIAKSEKGATGPKPKDATSVEKSKSLEGITATSKYVSSQPTLAEGEKAKALTVESDDQVTKDTSEHKSGEKDKPQGSCGGKHKGITAPDFPASVPPNEGSRRTKCGLVDADTSVRIVNTKEDAVEDSEKLITVAAEHLQTHDGQTSNLPASETAKGTNKDAGRTDVLTYAQSQDVRANASKSEPSKKRILNIDRVKIAIYSEGSKVHGHRMYERFFLEYWEALSSRIEEEMSDQDSLKCHSVIDKFLKTKRLRKLHNKLILGLLERCLNTSIPVSQKLDKAIPDAWRNRVQLLPRGSTQGIQNKATRSQVGKRALKEFPKKVQTRLDPCGLKYSPMILEAKNDRLPPKSDIPLKNSFRIPGAMAIDPYIRALAQATGMKVSENAVWLLVVAMREYVKAILRNCISSKNSIEAGEIPPFPLIRQRVIHKKRDIGDHESELLGCKGPNPAGGPANCITAHDIYVLASSMSVGNARSVGGSISRTAFERSLFSSMDSSVTLGGIASDDVRNFITLKLGPTSPQRLKGDEKQAQEQPSKSAVSSRIPTHPGRSGVASAPAGSNTPSQRAVSSVVATAASNAQPQRSAASTSSVSSIPNAPMKPAVPAPAAAASPAVSRTKATVSAQSSIQPTAASRKAPIGGLGRGAKDLAALKARASFSLKGTTQGTVTSGNNFATATPAPASIATNQQEPASNPESSAVQDDTFAKSPVPASAAQQSPTPVATAPTAAQSADTANKTQSAQGARMGRGHGVKNLAAMRARSVTQKPDGSSDKGSDSQS